MNKLKDWILDCASGPFGSNLKTENFIEKGFPIVDGANLQNAALTDNITKFVTEEKAHSLYRSIAKRHDVVVTISGTLGQIAYIPLDSYYDEYLCSQRQFRVTFDESKVDVEYLVYYFHTKEGQKKILSFANYVGVPALSEPLPNFKNIEVEFPDIKEQHRIVSVIKYIDSKIKVNNKISSKLESVARTLYNYWFLQFDFPNEKGKPYKSSGGKMVYNEQLKREIPKNWKVIRLGDKIIENSKSNIQVNHVDNIGNIPFFTSGDEILRCSNKLVSGLNIYMSTGGNASVKIYYGDAAYSTDTWCITAREYTIFYYFYLLSIKKQINNNFFAGSGLKHLKKDALKDVLLAIPPKQVIDKYNNIVYSHIKNTTNNKVQNIELAELRDFLLPLLMNGQVTFKDKKTDQETENQAEEIPQEKTHTRPRYNEGFELWLQQEGIAARGDVDRQTLKEIYDAMDDNDK